MGRAAAGPAPPRPAPGTKHLHLPIEKAHFTRYVALSGQAVDATCVGQNAAEMKICILKMGELLQAKIASARARGSTPWAVRGWSSVSLRKIIK